MPDCKYFQSNGLCRVDGCVYRHVKFHNGTKHCKDFKGGYCTKGILCNLLHDFADGLSAEKVESSGGLLIEPKTIAKGKKNIIGNSADSKGSTTLGNRKRRASNEFEEPVKMDYDGIEIFIPIDGSYAEDNLSGQGSESELIFSGSETKVNSDYGNSIEGNNLIDSTAIAELRENFADRYKSERHVLKLLEFIPQFILAQYSKSDLNI
jgi:hypothetical protein